MMHDPMNDKCNYDETKPNGSQLCNEIYNYCICPPAVDDVEQMQCTSCYGGKTNSTGDGLCKHCNGSGIEPTDLLRIVDQQRADLAAAQSELALANAEIANLRADDYTMMVTTQLSEELAAAKAEISRMEDEMYSQNHMDAVEERTIQPLREQLATANERIEREKGIANAISGSLSARDMTIEKLNKELAAVRAENERLTKHISDMQFARFISQTQEPTK